jgi:hypothetical protein
MNISIFLSAFAHQITFNCRLARRLGGNQWQKFQHWELPAVQV